MTLVLVAILLFALFHSLTADARIKERVKNILGERIYYGFYRLIYNSLSVVTILPVLLIKVDYNPILYDFSGWIMWVFRFIQLIGLIGLTISVLQIDWARFAGLKQVYAYFMQQSLPLSDEPLQTQGLYGIVRHPLYFFSMLVLWGSPSMTLLWLTFSVGATVYFIIGSWVEENRMLAAYGTAYQEYQKRVSWMIPFL